MVRIELPERISREFIYRCMGFGSSQPNEAGIELVEECEELLLEAAQPRMTYKEFSNGEIIDFFQGQDLAKHIEDCDSSIVMAVTLGIQVERLIRKYEIIDMAKAVALDACGSSLIEDICDEICCQLAAEYEAKGLYLTSRFSPGYGDLPLEIQDSFERLLDMNRRIGLSLTAEKLLIPRKSVTAVIGLKKKNEAEKSEAEKVGVFGVDKEEACSICSMKASCQFRKSGGYCGSV